MTPTKSIALALSSLLLVALIGCSNDSPTDATTVEEQPRHIGKWISGGDGSWIECYEDGSLQMQTDDGTTLAGKHMILSDGRLKIDISVFGGTHIETFGLSFEGNNVMIMTTESGGRDRMFRSNSEELAANNERKARAAEKRAEEEAARVKLALTQSMELELASERYYAEYRSFPDNKGWSPLKSDAETMRMLLGVATENNPRKVNFLKGQDYEPKDLLDPWGTHYAIHKDSHTASGYMTNIPKNVWAKKPSREKQFIARSLGADKTPSKDDIYSWSAQRQ